MPRKDGEGGGGEAGTDGGQSTDGLANVTPLNVSINSSSSNSNINEAGRDNNSSSYHSPTERPVEHGKHTNNYDSKNVNKDKTGHKHTIAQKNNNITTKNVDVKERGRNVLLVPTPNKKSQ